MFDLLEKLQTTAPVLFNETPALFAYLYGSHAQGKAHLFSDLDVGVFVDGLALKDCLDLELSLSLRLDELLEHISPSEVRVLNHLSLAVTGNILSYGRLIYSRHESKRVQFETQIRLAYFDFLPVIHQYQNHYRNKVNSEAFDGVY